VVRVSVRIPAESVASVRVLPTEAPAALLNNGRLLGDPDRRVNLAIGPEHPKKQVAFTDVKADTFLLFHLLRTG